MPYGDRSGTITEPYITEQWFLDVKKLAKETVKRVEKMKLSFFPNHGKKFLLMDERNRTLVYFKTNMVGPSITSVVRAR